MNAVPAKVAGVAAHRHGGAGAERRAQPARARGGGACRRAARSIASAGRRRSPRSPTAPRRITPVDKIVGPGNAYVAAAKRQVFGQVGIDMVAGPSEVVVIADGDNDPAWIAADLLAQAEHDAAAQVDPHHRRRGLRPRRRGGGRGRSLPCCRAPRSRARAGRISAPSSWSQSLDEAPRARRPPRAGASGDRDARPRALAARIRNAGAIFLGRYTPEAIGDYVAGTNHVLPTARSARFASGLGVLDFMKRTSILKLDADSLAALGPAAMTLAEAEGLDAHRRSVAIRLNRETRP